MTLGRGLGFFDDSVRANDALALLRSPALIELRRVLEFVEYVEM